MMIMMMMMMKEKEKKKEKENDDSAKSRSSHGSLYFSASLFLSFFLSVSASGYPQLEATKQDLKAARPRVGGGETLAVLFQVVTLIFVCLSVFALCLCSCLSLLFRPQLEAAKQELEAARQAKEEEHKAARTEWFLRKEQKCEEDRKLITDAEERHFQHEAVIPGEQKARNKKEEKDRREAICTFIPPFSLTSLVFFLTSLFLFVHGPFLSCLHLPFLLHPFPSSLPLRISRNRTRVAKS